MDLRQPYEQRAAVSLCSQLLPEDFKPTKESLSPRREYEKIQSVIKLGHSHAFDLFVYEISHESENDPRVTLSRDSFRLLADYGQRRALVFFTSRKSKNFRLSLVTIELKERTRGKTEKEYSNPRRFSFYLGPDAKVGTPERLLLGRITDFSDLQERFSIEVVNKEFYSQIAVLFTELAGGDRGEGNRQVHFPGLLRLPSLKPGSEVHKRFSVRLIGRLVFCWFLKKKSSGQGIPLIQDELLSSQAVQQHSGYYHVILEPLFFQTLNVPVKERITARRSSTWSSIPFLNGGLFDDHSDDFYETDVDGTSHYLNTLVVPDDWLVKLLKIFETYNFTIDENTPVDVELSIDPEMLGRIFENLLAEINPETGETARKATGSYYTPRSIVEYMVNESLKSYLCSHAKLNESDANSLLSWVGEEDHLTESSKEAVIKSLGQIRIIDPACGSGAFPMGLLQKMLLVLRKVDPESKRWRQKVLADVKDTLLRKKLEKENLEYIFKLGIIRDSIYGVDIQPIAMEISKLRFFLSLIVDERVDDSQENRGIQPLPNLEFKFVCADSLIPLPKPDSDGMLIDMADEDQESISRLKQLRDEYFTSYGKEKRDLERRFRETQDKMKDFYIKRTHKTQRNLRNEEMGIKTKEVSPLTKSLALWDPFKSVPSPWFDSEWMFGLTKGFDICIGNPPYGLLNKRQNKAEAMVVSDEQLEYYKTSSQYAPAATGMINIFRLFILQSAYMLAEQGTLCEIFPLAFIGDASAAQLRKYLLNNYSIRFIETFPERDNPKKRVFEAAKMSVCILNLQNIQIADKSFFLRIHRDRFVDENNPKTVLDPSIIQILDKNNYTIPLMMQEDLNLAVKIYKNSILLGDIAHCYTGEIDLTLGKRYFSKDPKDARLIRGANIDRYILKNKMSQGETLYLHAKRYLSENIGKRLEHLKTDRIILQGITGVNEKVRLKMTLIGPDSFCANSVNYVAFQNGAVDKKCALGVLNSKLLNYLFMKFSTNSNTNGYEVDNLPLPKEISLSNQKRIALLVDAILKIKKKSPSTDTKALEQKIDKHVYQLYRLTPEEINIVEESTH